MSSASLADLIAEGRLVEALEAMLEQWRTAPSASLSTVIRDVSEATREEISRVAGATKAARTAWDAAAATATITQRPALLDRIADCKYAEALPRLAIVAGWMPDPRVDAWIVSVIEAPPFSATGSKPFWKALFPLVEKITDPTLAPRLSACPRKIHATIAPTMAGWLAPQLEKVLPRLDAQPHVSDEILALKGTTKSLGRDDELASLLAAVYADPEADAPRLVYADAASERGDARGEFIGVQMRLAATPGDRELRAREKELLHGYGKQWLGKAGQAIKGDYRYERGFLAQATLNVTFVQRERVAELAGNPVFSTVHTLDAPLPIAIHPSMRALRSLRYESDDRDDWQDLLITTERPLRSLWMRLAYHSARLPQQAALYECVALPKLESLIVRSQLDLRFLLELAHAPVVRRLSTLGLEFPVAFESLWPIQLRVLFAAAPVEHLQIQTNEDGPSYTLHREGGAYTSADFIVPKLHPSHHPSRVSDMLVLVRELRSLKKLNISLHEAFDPEQRARLESELATLEIAVTI